jgi:hypothetical protein
MEKLSTVDLVLLCPMVNVLAKKQNEPLSHLFTELYNKLRSELEARPMESFISALRTIKAIEPRTDSGELSEFIQMIELIEKMGIKYGVKS